MFDGLNEKDTIGRFSVLKAVINLDEPAGPNFDVLTEALPHEIISAFKLVHDKVNAAKQEVELRLSPVV